MKNSLFFLSVVTSLLNHAVFLASDNNISKHPRLQCPDDLKIYGTPRTIEESLILSTATNKFAILYLQTRGDLYEKRFEIHDKILESHTTTHKIFLEFNKALLEKLTRRKKTLKELKHTIEKQNIFIHGLTFATTLLTGYVIVKEISQFLKRDSLNED